MWRGCISCQIRCFDHEEPQSTSDFQLILGCCTIGSAFRIIIEHSLSRISLNLGASACPGATCWQYTLFRLVWKSRILTLQIRDHISRPIVLLPPLNSDADLEAHRKHWVDAQLAFTFKVSHQTPVFELIQMELVNLPKVKNDGKTFYNRKKSNHISVHSLSTRG